MTYIVIIIIIAGDKPRLHQLTLLTKRNGKKLRIVEFVAANWKKLAVRLGFESPRMNNITQGTFYQPEEGCLRMFEKWLAGEHDLKPPTWLNLIECLEEVTEFEGLAQDLKEIIT